MYIHVVGGRLLEVITFVGLGGYCALKNMCQY